MALRTTEYRWPTRKNTYHTDHENEVSLRTCQDLDTIHRIRLGVLPICLDNRQLVAVDGEDVVGIARHGDDSESVAFALHNIEYRKINLRTTRVSSLSVDKRSIIRCDASDGWGLKMIPVTQGDYRVF